MHPKRRFPTVVLPVSAGFVASALLWSVFAVPTFVKYPTDLEVTPRYEGTFTLFADRTTVAPLATPLRVPLDIERHIRALDKESGSSRVVVEETIRQRAGDLVDTTQTNVYVMDRRSMQNVADDRSYAFDPSNVVDRSGAYRLNLPFDTSSDSTYAIYKNEIATTYETRASTATPTTENAGLHLRNFTGSRSEAPIAQAYLTELNKSVSLPRSMTLDQLKPQLAAAGLDVDAVLAAVTPVITADDLATLARLSAKPIALRYVLSFDGTAGVEATTGAEADVVATESIGVKPVLADAATLQAIIAHYPDVPEAVAAGQALAAIRSAPAMKIFEYHYEQTPASVADIAGDIKSMRNQIRVVERYVPLGLLGTAAVSLLVGAFVSWRRRGPTIDVRTAPPAVRPAPRREPVSSRNPR